jgi:hypothetical protein
MPSSAAGAWASSELVVEDGIQGSPDRSSVHLKTQQESTGISYYFAVIIIRMASIINI